MPINSFENFPMSWKPDKSQLTPPLYLALARQMEEDIRAGRLEANTKLPPQRELADFLDLNLSTVTKAYQICRQRGLIRGVTGRGTFVTPYANVSTSVVDQVEEHRIEMGTINPDLGCNGLLRDLAIDLLKGPLADTLFEYRHPMGTWHQRQMGARWLTRFGLHPTADEVQITSGVQNGLAVALTSLFSAGDRIAVDSLTYPNFIALAGLLGLQLVPVEGDGEGMRPDLLEKLCRTLEVKGCYLMPAGSNPTNRVCSPQRKRDLAAVIRRYDLVAIEDDNLAGLAEEPPRPLACEAPDHVLYLSGLSKPIGAGLRVAYLLAPARFREKLFRDGVNLNLKIPSLTTEIAAEAIRTGLTETILQTKRAASRARNAVFQEIFPKVPILPLAYTQWLPLPPDRTGQDCERAMDQRGIGVFGAERFAVGDDAPRHAVRLATCSPDGEASLREGLLTLRTWLAGAQD